MSGAVTVLTCPHCGRLGKTTTSIPAGAKIRCPGCHQTFSHEPAEQGLAAMPRQEPLPPTDHPTPATGPPPLPQPLPIHTAKPTDQQFSNDQKIGAWIAGGGLLLLGLSPFFKWMNFLTGGIIGLSGDGKILLAVTVIGAIAYLSAIIKRKWVIPVILGVQAWGTLAVFWMGALLWKIGSIFDSPNLQDSPFAAIFATQLSPGAGLYLGLIGGIAVAGALGFVAVRYFIIAGNLKPFYLSQGLSCLLGILLAVFVGPGRLSSPKDVTPGSTSHVFAPWGETNAANKEARVSKESEEPKPTPAGRPLRRGDIEFNVDSAEITKVTKEDGYFLATFPEKPVLIVRFTAKNKSIDKRYFYSDYIESMTDDLGNHYEYIQGVPTGLKEFQGYEHNHNAAIDPGEIIKCSAVFEKPLKSAKRLVMEIPGRVIARSPEPTFSLDSEPSYRFVISMDTVKQ